MERTRFQKTTLAMALALGWCAVAEAQQSATAPVTSLGPLIVTGTRQSNRTVEDSLSPIQLLNEDALEHTGKVGLEEILSNVLPSLSLPSQAGGDLSSIVRVFTLRGLNPDQVLVLINGKRRHVTSIVNVAGVVATGAEPVDLNMIPVSAVDHIEVLSDGAAAQYGSDAIAGVINIILKSHDSGGSADMQVGKYYAGDGFNYQLNGNDGFKLGTDGFLNLSVSIAQQDITNRALPATLTPLYYPGDPRNQLPAGIVYKGYGIPDSKTQSFAFNTGKPINSDVALYAFGTFAHSFGQNWEGFRAANNNNNVLADYPNGFEPREDIHQQDFGLTVGIKGENLMNWRWDLSSTYGRNWAPISLEHSVNPTFGLSSPTLFNEGAFTASEFTNNLDFTRSFDTGVFQAPLGVAWGLEYRSDKYGITAGELASYANGGQPQLTGPNAGLFVDVPGAQSFAGFRPADAGNHSRDNISAYVDLETSLTANWDAGLAGRFEHYSDFGDNVSGKLSTRYQFTPAIAARGTVSNGFRAPSVGEEFYSASTTSQFQGVDYNIVTLPATSLAAGELGAQPLKPKKSVNYSLGMVLKPIPKMTLTIDGYRIDIKDRIVESANIGLSPSGVLDPAVAALLQSVNILGVNAGRYFLNGADTSAVGIDIIGTYLTNFGAYGSIAWTAAANAGHTRITKVLPSASQILFTTQVFNQVAQDDLTKTTPNNKLILSADYSVGRWNVFLRETRFGTFTAPSTVAGGYSPENPKWTTDLEFGFDVTKQMHIAIGAQNLFDVYPSKTNPKNFNPATFNGAQIYNADSPFGLSGGNYYARLSYTWQ